MNLFGRSRRPSAAPPTRVRQGSVFREQNGSITKSNKAGDLIHTLERIREKVSVIDKREAFQVTKSEAQTKEASAKLSVGDKRGALLCLKRKKELDRDIEKLVLMKDNLEQLIMSIETSSVTLQVQHGLSEGLAAQRKLGLDPDKIAQMQADIEEELAKIDEATNAISHPLISSPLDDEEVLQEMREMQAEIRHSHIQQLSPHPHQPQVDTTSSSRVASTSEVEEREIQGLMPPSPSPPVLPVAPVMVLPQVPTHQVRVDDEDDEVELALLAAQMS